MLQRYFIEVSYKGEGFSGFQSQDNAVTIQSEIEKAFTILQRAPIEMTGSSRTDAGVHALQNFLHFDFADELNPQFVYKMNAILPSGIVVRSIRKVDAEAHCRFDAQSRYYQYFLYQHKDPFLEDRAYYFPYNIDESLLNEAASMVMSYSDFTSFSKRNTQVKTFQCSIMQSEWVREGDCLIYKVRANRFLRGMVRALVATMLQVGRGKITLDEFKLIIEAKDCTKASFAVPAHGLFLSQVHF
jgi:tRNA pseudouridine38-40 synthase